MDGSRTGCAIREDKGGEYPQRLLRLHAGKPPVLTGRDDLPVRDEAVLAGRTRADDAKEIGEETGMCPRFNMS